MNRLYALLFAKIVQSEAQNVMMEIRILQMGAQLHVFKRLAGHVLGSQQFALQYVKMDQFEDQKLAMTTIQTLQMVVLLVWKSKVGIALENLQPAYQFAKTD